MSGQMILVGGIGFIAAAAVLLVVSFIYHGTAGRKIREQLKDEYE